MPCRSEILDAYISVVFFLMFYQAWPPYGVLVHGDRQGPTGPTNAETGQERKMVMSAVRLFRVYLKSWIVFLFRQLGRGNKQLRDRCNLLDLLVRVFKIRGFISFFSLFSFHSFTLFTHYSADLRYTPTRISQPKPYLKLASARSEGNVN